MTREIERMDERQYLDEGQGKEEIEPKQPMTIGRGWNWLHNSTKWHFFKHDGVSLCGRWMTFTTEGYQLGNDKSPDNCKACQKKLAKLQAMKPLEE